MKQVVHTTRVNSHFVPEDGYLNYEQPGTCKYNVILYKINTYTQFHEAMASWLRGRYILQPITVDLYDAAVLRNLIGWSKVAVMKP